MLLHTKSWVDPDESVGDSLRDGYRAKKIGGKNFHRIEAYPVSSKIQFQNANGLTIPDRCRHKRETLTVVNDDGREAAFSEFEDQP
jgi:hypothetical protein